MLYIEYNYFSEVLSQILTVVLEKKNLILYYEKKLTVCKFVFKSLADLNMCCGNKSCVSYYLLSESWKYYNIVNRIA